MKTILVLNMGMKSIRSIIFDSEGNKLASYAVPIETYRRYSHPSSLRVVGKGMQSDTRGSGRCRGYSH